MKIIVGLGNPGKKYAGTRHNVGFMVLDELAQTLGAGFVEKKKQQAYLARTEYEGSSLLLVKPTTYMNESGRAVRALMDYYDLSLEDLLVVVDDLHLDLGFLRLRGRGSAGGQNGIKNIILHLSSQDFARLKVGIGSAHASQAIGHVLGRFSKEERKIMDPAIDRAKKACLSYLSRGLAQTMNDYNG